MKLLLDSHVFIWMLYEPRLVTASVTEAVESAAQVSVSIVSLWELALKYGAGKLPHDPAELRDGVEQLGVSVEAVTVEHIVESAQVQLDHKDPFDVMLIAQCQSGKMQLVTADRALLASRYDTLDARSRAVPEGQ